MTVAALVVAAVVTIAPRPVLAQVPDVTVVSDSPDLEAAGSGRAEDTVSTGAFEMIGVTAADGTVPAGAAVSVHDPELGWGPWIPLADTEGDHGPDAGTAEADRATASTDPMWVGEADGYRVSVLDEAADEHVRVHLVSEGSHPAVAVDEGEAGAAGAADVNARASWSAAPYNGTPSYAAGLERAVIHHTVNANDYSSADVPAMIRAIQAYHQGVNGWDDIGYNFIVDRFGRTWEGRSGSIANATVGAHTAGANTGSVGVAFLGDGRADSPPATVDAAGALLSWKMPAHGATPNRTNVFGHRDLGATECPGGLLYADLHAIVLAAQPGFPDVPAWVAEAVDWLLANGHASGYPDNTFRPDNPITRAEVIRMLHRIAGTPDVTDPDHPFTDVAPWIDDAVRWATHDPDGTGPAEPIAAGYPDTTFRPDNPITRAQVIRMLHRIAGTPDVTDPDHPFTDVAPWIDDAVRWATHDPDGTGPAEPIAAGYPDTTFRPDNPITRAQVARMLYRLDT